MVIGPNGSGKTNLLEALYVLARGKSFRVADAELLQHNADWLRVEAKVDDRYRVLTLKKAGPKVEKRLQVDSVTKTRLSASALASVVLFEPRDMQLLTGSPERRREYLDSVLEQLEAGYARLTTQYRRALAQRNALLKQSHHLPADHLFVWNVRLSELGAQIVSRRRELVQQLQVRASAVYSDISGQKSEVEVQYVTSVQASETAAVASALLHQLEGHIARDRERGFTSVGPHRDDLHLVLNGAPASTSASRGETRSLVVMLKLLEAELLQQRQQQAPLILLDDVFGELDARRRHALATRLHDYQVIITATDAEGVQDALPSSAHVIRMDK